MLHWLRRDTFVKDIALLLLISILGASVLSVGFALTTDKYFAKAVTGVIGDFGECDLLFQTREELKGALVRQLRQIIAERFPGATLRAGMTLAGKASFFLTLPEQYKTKAAYNSLRYYFNNLPGNGGFAVMTEPKLAVTSIPAGIFDTLSREVEKIKEVRFTYDDGGNIGIILYHPRDVSAVTKQVKKILDRYQILEITPGVSEGAEELPLLAKRVSQSLTKIMGAAEVKDVTMTSSSNDYQYLVNTLYEVKRFLLAYAAEVSIVPEAGWKFAEGDLVVLNSRNCKKLQPGGKLEPLHVVVKVTGVKADMVQGLIIQGDAGFLVDNVAYKLLPGDKIGPRNGVVTVSSRKSQLMHAMDQGVVLLSQLDRALTEYQKTAGGPGLTLEAMDKAYRRLTEVQAALKTAESSLTGLNGEIDRRGIFRMATLLNGVGDDLTYLAQTFARVQVFESRFRNVLQGFKGVRFLIGSPLFENTVGRSGAVYDKIQIAGSKLQILEKTLNERVGQLDDFINRFNPLVAVLMSWREKARSFAAELEEFNGVLTPGSAGHQQLLDLIHSSDTVIGAVTGLDSDGMKAGLKSLDRFFGTGELDLSSIIEELQRAREALPKLMDEEIGRAIGLIDRYAGGEKSVGESIRIFTSAKIKREKVEDMVKTTLGHPATIFSVPAGTIQPDIRGEVFKILAEVRSTIAALLALALWVLTFILDQSLIIAMLKQISSSPLPQRFCPKHPILGRGYRFISGMLHPSRLYAALIGGLWLETVFLLSGAAIPYLTPGMVILLGGLCGILMTVIAEKINPINKDEVMAGLSLGLPVRTIMREIVIPAGRPGVLQFLNRWKMVMK